MSQERKIECAIIYETMAYTAADPGSQEMPPRLGWLYPGQISRIKRHGFVGGWTLVLCRGFAASVAKYFAEGLAYTANPQVPIVIRDLLDETPKTPHCSRDRALHSRAQALLLMS